MPQTKFDIPVVFGFDSETVIGKGTIDGSHIHIDVGADCNLEKIITEHGDIMFICFGIKFH